MRVCMLLAAIVLLLMPLPVWAQIAVPTAGAGPGDVRHDVPFLSDVPNSDEYGRDFDAEVGDEYEDEGEYEDGGEYDDESEGEAEDQERYGEYLQFTATELPNGRYTWTIVERMPLPEGGMRVCRIACDANHVVTTTCTVLAEGEAEPSGASLE